MIVTFDSGLFGAENGISGVVPTPTVEASGYSLTCGLGECNMQHKVVGNEVVFSFELAQQGVDRTRSEIENNKIELGELTLVTSPFAVGVTFECSYPMGITVESDPFSVQDIDVTGAKTSTGKLDDGFSLELTDESGGPNVVLGGLLEVAAKWEVTGLSDVTFYFDRCGVVHGAKTVNVIQDSCYSVALKAGGGVSTPTEITFKFKTFGVEGENATSQTLTCDIKLCVGDICGKAKTDDECPSGTQEDFFQYKVIGVNY
jgi:hypothetical protein